MILRVGRGKGSETDTGVWEVRVAEIDTEGGEGEGSETDTGGKGAAGAKSDARGAGAARHERSEELERRGTRGANEERREARVTGGRDENSSRPP